MRFSDGTAGYPRGGPYIEGMRETTARSEETVRTRALALWLLLFSIFTHALVPIGSPLQRANGSAFSAFTSEVSLSPDRKAQARQQRQLQDAGGEGSDGGDPSGDDLARAAPAALAPQLAQQSRFAAAPAAEPAAEGGAAAFDARGPPLA